MSRIHNSKEPVYSQGFHKFRQLSRVRAYGRYPVTDIITFQACRLQWPRGLRRASATARLLGMRVRNPLGAWKSVSCECCVLSGKVYATGGSLVQRSPTECGVCVSLSVIRCNNNPLHLQWVGRRGQTKKESEFQMYLLVESNCTETAIANSRFLTKAALTDLMWPDTRILNWNIKMNESGLNLVYILL